MEARTHDEDAGRVMRPSADATMEIRAEDVLEAIDVDRPSIRMTSSASRGDDMASIAPVALEIYSREYAFGPEESLSMRIRLRRPPNPRLIAAVGAAVGVCIVILAAAGIRTAMGPRTDDATTATAATKVTVPTPASTSIATDSLPPVPSSGTIVFPRRSAITLDGARVTTASAIVRCGDHTVRINRAAPRKVDVPCGGTLDLDKKR
jgi:hypothetical protein